MRHTRQAVTNSYSFILQNTRFCTIKIFQQWLYSLLGVMYQVWCTKNGQDIWGDWKWGLTDVWCPDSTSLMRFTVPVMLPGVPFSWDNCSLARTGHPWQPHHAHHQYCPLPCPLFTSTLLACVFTHNHVFCPAYVGSLSLIKGWLS